MAEYFKVGDCFPTFRALQEKINNFVKSSWTALYKRDSRKINNYWRNKSPGTIINEDLVYGEMKYCCIHGGRSDADTKNRKVTNQIECPFTLCIRADRDGKYLRITKAVLEHNHPVSKEIYDQLPARCRFRFESNSVGSATQKRNKKRKKTSKTGAQSAAVNAAASAQKAKPSPDKSSSKCGGRGRSSRDIKQKLAETSSTPLVPLPDMTETTCGSSDIQLDTMTLRSYYERQRSQQDGSFAADMHMRDEVNRELLTFLRRHNSLDEEDRFFLSMAGLCRRLPEDERITVKLRIHQMIFEATTHTVKMDNHCCDLAAGDIVQTREPE